MSAVGVVPNIERAEAAVLARDTVAALQARGARVVLPAREAQLVGLDDLAVPAAEFGDGLDLVLSLGGDGTMLHTVGLVYPRPVPVCGVNAGNLGYLSAMESHELAGALDDLLAGNFAVSERTMLECRVERGGAGRTDVLYALNEAVLEKVHAGRLVRLDVAINGHPFTSYAADGVIVATPTGSTAYTFSVHGPIVSPSTQVIVLTPVSPHMLFDRSLVVGRDETIELTVSAERPVALTIDGREIDELAPGDRIVARAADAPARLALPRELLFHQLLKAKFSLPDR